MDEHGGVQGEGPEGEGVAVRGPHGAQLLPGVRHGVPGAAEDVGADLPHVVDVPGGVVDVPRPVDLVELRGPDVDGLGAALVLDPDGALLRLPQAPQRGGAAQDNPVVLRHGGGEITAPVAAPQDIGVRPLEDEGAVIDCLADRYVAHSDIPPAAARGRGCDECIIACLCPGCKRYFSF